MHAPSPSQLLFPKVSPVLTVQSPITPRNLKALVLDLDGTLLDTAPGLTGALNQALADVGRPKLTLDAVKPMIGDGVEALIERAAIATGGPLATAAFEQTIARYRTLMQSAPTPTVFAGARAALGNFNEHGIKLAVCTNKPEAAARQVLDRTNLIPFLNAVIGADNIPLKPDPAMINRALDELGVDADAAVLIGDSEVDVATARAAHLPVVLLSHGYVRGPIAEAGADAVTGDFASLPDALTQIGFRFGS
jgi:phosphoglycolate phosphatase